MMLDLPRAPDGETLRQRLQSVERVTGVAESGLRLEVPPSCTQLWDTYLGLAAARRSGTSAQALVWADIAAWCALYQVHLTAWELDTLTAMDNAALGALHQAQAEDRALPNH